MMNRIPQQLKVILNSSRTQIQVEYTQIIYFVRLVRSRRYRTKEVAGLFKTNEKCGPADVLVNN